VARGFRNATKARQKLVRETGFLRRRQSFYFKLRKRLFANYAGEPEVAVEFYRRIPPHYVRNESDERNLSVVLSKTWARRKTSLGFLERALGHLSEGLWTWATRSMTKVAKAMR